MSIFRINPRYYRWHIDLGIEWSEANTGYDTLDWEIPLEQVAVVALDTWAFHYLVETQKRINRISEDEICPLLKKCRTSGLQIVHAPGVKVAVEHPQWARLVDESELEWPVLDCDWPPKDFVGSAGAFSKYDYPFEPRQAWLEERRLERCFHPLLEPVAGETVVANGEELHRYCKQKGILFLLYLGFNTNHCIMLNDYGMTHMHNRGYKVTLIRDCTTGMESFETVNSLDQTKAAILHLEMTRRFSITATEVMEGLP
jgi:nicotinamidase-related amidase